MSDWVERATSSMSPRSSALPPLLRHRRPSDGVGPFGWTDWAGLIDRTAGSPKDEDPGTTPFPRRRVQAVRSRRSTCLARRCTARPSATTYVAIILECLVAPRGRLRTRPASGLTHHTDRGSRYAAEAYRKVSGKHGIVRGPPHPTNRQTLLRLISASSSDRLTGTV